VGFVMVGLEFVVNFKSRMHCRAEGKRDTTLGGSRVDEFPKSAAITGEEAFERGPVEVEGEGSIRLPFEEFALGKLVR
jgi:hypothetical protein